MLNSSRPLRRSSTGRNNQHIAKPDKSAQDDASQQRQHSIRDFFKAAPQLIQPSVSVTTYNVPEEQRNNYIDNKRARRASSSHTATTAAISNPHEARPPTKVTVTQPHGELLQTTNGVRTSIGVVEDAALTKGKSAATAGQQLQPPGKQDSDKRTLRSQDGGSRLKSDLAIYFPNYEDIISDAPKPAEFLSIDTPIHVVDDIAKSASKSNVKQPSHSNAPPRNISSPLKPTTSASNATHVSDAPPKPSFQTIDFGAIGLSTKQIPNIDPLTDDVYFKAHRRAERKEKQLRNIEKERAMHEKVQLERLLAGLQGHDWLRVMGVTGITETEKKDFEPKRDFFVSEVKALVDKFRQWKEEEKRLKQEREEALAAQEENDDEEEDEAEGGAEDNNGDSRDTLDSSDIDLRAARQLQQEARSASISHYPPIRLNLLPPRPPSPKGPFTSFYSKPHLRAAALGKHRHGRNVTAFGQAIPDLPEEEDFALPPEYVTPDALRDNARKRRRLRRDREEARRSGGGQ